VLAVAPRAGLQRGDVGTAGRFGDRQCGYFFAGDDVGQHAGFQCLAAGVQDRRRADAVRHQRSGHAAATGARQFFGGDQMMKSIGVRRTAVFGREAETEQADRGGFFVELQREAFCFVPLVGVGRDFLFDETAQGLAKVFVGCRIEGGIWF
jgi:hypothetical protein